MLPLAAPLSGGEANGSEHFVQFYHTGAFLLDAVSRFIGGTLAAGDTAIVIATQSHQDQLAEAFTARGLDLPTLRRHGRYIALDAPDTLSKIMVDGWPDETRFAEVVGGAIQPAAAEQPQRVQVFAEVVASLYIDGQRDAAIRLEELWSELAKQVEFSLLCAYPLSAFHHESDGSSFLKICAAHTHVIPAETYTSLTSPDEQLRTISSLQQKANALDTATAELKKAEQSITQLQEELKARTEELAEVDHRKDEFLAMLGHELRNPLAPLRNAVHLLGHSEDGTQVNWMRGLIDRQVSQLTRLVDDLLEVSRIRRGKIVLRKAPTSVAAIVGGAVEAVRPQIDTRKQHLVVSLNDTPIVDADHVRMTQVVTNLLDNAAKYTAEGGHIWISTERVGGAAIIRVRDMGVGINADTLPFIFEPFRQADRSLDRSQGGLGIGLTIAQGLVELHGGRLTASSGGLQQGSEFVVSLPELRVGVQADPGTERHIHRGMHHTRRVLIVDDNGDAAESLGMLLSIAGHEIRTAFDGLSAIEAAQRFQPDVVILDIGLPGIDGYEVARRLRRLLPREVLLVALTGYGQEEDRQRSKEAGFDHHIVKPVLLGSLEQLLDPASPAPQPTVH